MFLTHTTHSRTTLTEILVCGYESPLSTPLTRGGIHSPGGMGEVSGEVSIRTRTVGTENRAIGEWSLASV